MEYNGFVNGKKIKELRIAAGITPILMAVAAGYSATVTIFKMEAKEKHPLNVNIAKAIAAKLKVSLDTIRGEG